MSSSWPIGRLAPALVMLSASACDATSSGEAQSNATAAAPAAEQKFDTGNSGIDTFLAAVAKRDESAVAQQIGSVQSLSGRPAGFDDAHGYLDRVKDCTITKAVKDAPGTAWVYWSCSDRQYRQTIDAKYAAPKMTITELY